MENIRDVAILYSGGKDSNFALDYCLKKGYNVKYLLSIKPNRKDCYLFHYATVEHTKLQAEMLGIKHILVNCDVADPVMEANLVREVVSKNKVDALLLGGVGLQVTQIESVQKALLPLGVEVFASHAGDDHGKLIESMISDGYEIMITQVAGEGLVPWLGKTLNLQNFEQLQKDSQKYGFHLGFEGGYADTFVVDAPFFTKKIQLQNISVIVDGECTGHIEAESAKLVQKEIKLRL